MVHKLAGDAVLAGEQRHLQRVQRQAGAQVVRDLPADDLPGKQVRDERRVHEPAGRSHIRDVRDPAPVRRRRGEVPLQQVSGPAVRAGRHRGPRLLALRCHTGDAQLAHQPLYRAPSHHGAFPAQLPPYFPCPVYPAAFPPVFPGTHDLLFQVLIPDLTR